MNINDALNVLNLAGTVTMKDVKKAYKACSLKYHPDRQKASELEMMKLVNLAYSFLKSLNLDPITQTDGFVENDYCEEFNNVLDQLFELQKTHNINIEICGMWAWITGETKPLAAKLGRKDGGIGCYFSRKKTAWYYRPAEYKSASRKSHSMDEIRARHGSVNATSAGRKTQTRKSIAA